MNLRHQTRQYSTVFRVLSGILALTALFALYGCLGGGGTGTGGSGTPADTAKIEKTVTGFLSTLRSGGQGQANPLFSPRLQALEGAGSLDTLLVRSFGPDISNPADDEPFTFCLETDKIVYLSSSLARLTAWTQFTDGQRLQVAFTMVLEDGTWLIDFIEATMLGESTSLLSEDPANSAAIWPLGPSNRWLFLVTLATDTPAQGELRFRQLSLAAQKQLTTEGLEYYDMTDRVFDGTIGQTNAVFGLDPAAMEFGKSIDSPGFTDGGYFPVYPATSSPDLWTLLDPAGNGVFSLATALGLWMKQPDASTAAPWWKLTGLLAVPGAQVTQTVLLSDSKGNRREVELKLMVMPPVLQTLPWVTARAVRLDISSRVIATGETGFSTILFVPGIGPTAYGRYDTATRRLTETGYLLEADVNGRALRSTSTPVPTPGVLAVVSTVPADNATGVASLASVLVTFDAPLEPATVVASHVTAIASGVFLAGELTASGTELHFVRPEGWPVGERVDIAIGTGVLSLTGLGLPSPWTFGFTVATGTISTPLITAMSPATATASGLVTLSITGTGFLASATFRLTMTGQAPITAFASTNTDTRATATFDLTGATPGNWLLGVANTDGGTGLSGTALAVSAMPPAPVVTAVSPNFATNTAPIALTVGGSNFFGAPTVSLTHATLATLTAVPGTVTPTSLAVTFDLTGIPSGTRTLTVTNPDGQVSGGIPFAVNDPVPPAVASSFSPLSARGETTAAISVTGSSLFATTTIRLVATGQADIPGTSVTVSGDTYLSASFNLIGAAPGPWDLVLYNPGSVDVVASTPFTVDWPLPVLTSVTPTSAPNIGTALVLVAGNFFRMPSAALLGAGGLVINGTREGNYNGENMSTYTFNLAGVPFQTMSLYVTNYGGGSCAVPLPFTVRGLASPTVTTFTPTHSPVRYSYGNVIVEVYGSDFVSGANVQFYTGMATETVTTYYMSSGQLHAVFTPTLSPPATYSIRVVNPSGDVATAPGTFLLEAPPPLPTVTSITPGVVWNTDNYIDFQIDGTGFVDLPYLSINYSIPGYSYGIESGEVTFVDSTRLMTRFSFHGSPPGSWTLDLKNPYGYPALDTATITVLASAPTIASIEPATGTITQTVPVTINGTDFYNFTTVKLASASYADIPASIDSAYFNRITCSFNLANAPVTGPWDLVITNYDGRSATGTFLILPAP